MGRSRPITDSRGRRGLIPQEIESASPQQVYFDPPPFPTCGLNRPPPPPPPFPPLQSGRHSLNPRAASPASQGSECETYLADDAHLLHLPEFPPFPHAFSVPELPPIPRLMPNWERLQSRLSPQRGAHQSAPTAAAQAAGGDSGGGRGAAYRPVAIGALAGFSIGLVAILLLQPRWMRRGRRSASPWRGYCAS